MRCHGNVATSWPINFTMHIQKSLQNYILHHLKKNLETLYQFNSLHHHCRQHVQSKAFCLPSKLQSWFSFKTLPVISKNHLLLTARLGLKFSTHVNHCHGPCCSLRCSHFVHKTKNGYISHARWLMTAVSYCTLGFKSLRKVKLLNGRKLKLNHQLTAASWVRLNSQNNTPGTQSSNDKLF